MFFGRLLYRVVSILQSPTTNRQPHSFKTASQSENTDIGAYFFKERNIMMKTRTLLTSAYMIPVVGLLVLAGVFSNALADCPPPPGVTDPPDPPVTAQQVADGSATLKDFARIARDETKKVSLEATTNRGRCFTLDVSSGRKGDPGVPVRSTL